MGIGPYLAVRGALIGSLVVILVCLGTTANIEPGAAARAAAPAEGGIETDVSTPSGDCQVSSQYPASILQWCQAITAAALAHGLSPNLVAAVMLQESGGDPLAYSSSGAVGLMQVMPRDGLAAAFMCPNGPCFASRPTIAELQDPAYNIEYGTRMLAGLQQRYGDLRQALKAYGPRDMDFRYADIVLAIYESYR